MKPATYLAVVISMLLGSSIMAFAHDDKNVLGEKLQPHEGKQLSGFYRDGYCRTDAGDVGQHTVAAIVTKEFLDFTKSKGNDLLTPRPEYGFPGLAPGDNWCLCTARWQEAEKAGVAPPINLQATQQSTLKLIPLATLKKYGTENPQ